MKSVLSCTALSFAIFSMAGCSSSCDCEGLNQQLFESTLNPTPPFQQKSIEAESKQSIAVDSVNSMCLTSFEEPKIRSLKTALPTSTLPKKFERAELADAARFISIMGQDGAVITVWALARRNWLWGYSPMDSSTFGSVRNWKIERSFRREHFRFINQSLGTCMQAYGNGIIHDTCDNNNLDQDFELMPTSTGTIFIKSVSQQRCITYDPVSVNIYDTLTLSKCDDNISSTRDQNWFLAPPLLPTNPDLSGESK